MVATSVAGRGLDVPELCCVINYSVPNHLEDYVHRVGRTGRAGRKGTAYTFITPGKRVAFSHPPTHPPTYPFFSYEQNPPKQTEEDQYAPLLLKALSQSKQEVPPELTQMAASFQSKIDAGQAQWASSGFGGKGFTFDESEQTGS